MPVLSVPGPSCSLTPPTTPGSAGDAAGQPACPRAGLARGGRPPARRAEAGPALLSSAPSPFAAVVQWLHLFVDFLGTKHGLARVWQGDPAGITRLRELFLERLVPVLADLLAAARASGEVVAEIGAYELVRAVGDLVAWNPQDPDYDVRRIVTLLVAGLRQEQPARQVSPMSRTSTRSPRCCGPPCTD